MARVSIKQITVCSDCDEEIYTCDKCKEYFYNCLEIICQEDDIIQKHYCIGCGVDRK